MEPSFFNFRFRLLPWEACLNLNFDRLELPLGAGAVCTRDELGLVMVGEPTQFDGMMARAHQLATGLVHAAAYRAFPGGNLVIDVQPITWLEVPNWTPTARGTVTGYMHRSLAHHGLDPAHPDNAPWRDALGVLIDAHRFPALYLALADFHAALREPGPYFAFFAFRALEDVAQMFGPGTEGKLNWAAMNEAFGTDKAHWEPLTVAGTAARHLKWADAGLAGDENRQGLLTLAHESIARALEHIEQSEALELRKRPRDLATR